jgi:hypothetical protein
MSMRITEIRAVFWIRVLFWIRDFSNVTNSVVMFLVLHKFYLYHSGVRPSVTLLMSCVSSSGKDCAGSIHGIFEGLWWDVPSELKKTKSNFSQPVSERTCVIQILIHTFLSPLTERTGNYRQAWRDLLAGAV